MSKPTLDPASLAVGEQQAANILGVSRETLRRGIRDGLLRTVRFRGRVLVPRTELERIVAGGGDAA